MRRNELPVEVKRGHIPISDDRPDWVIRASEYLTRGETHLGQQSWRGGQLEVGEIEKGRERVAGRQARPLVPELVEERVAAPVEGFDAPFRIVRERRSDEIYGLVGCF